jgi:hypothetical protein
MRIDIGLTGDRLLQHLKTALLKHLTFEDNIDSSTIDIDDTGPANTEFLVQHNLGRVPKYYIANTDSGFITDSSRSSWAPTQMWLKCSSPNAKLKLVVF